MQQDIQGQTDHEKTQTGGTCLLKFLNVGHILQKVYKMSLKKSELIIKFPSTKIDKKGFDVLCCTDDKFFYIGNKQYQINEKQKNALDFIGIPYERF